MSVEEKSLRAMPDVAGAGARQLGAALDWVGMSGIHLPLQVSDAAQGVRSAHAFIQAYVSLDDPAARGIHMSRLFLGLEDVLGQAPLSLDSLARLLGHFLATHQDLSQHAFVELAFDYSLRRAALKSQNAGWKSYPVKVTATRRGEQVRFELQVDVAYSSTCPCSAALARQLIQEAFKARFGEDGQVPMAEVLALLGSEQGIVATPHSQRSVAQVKVDLDPEAGEALPITHLIDLIEQALQTPVQTAVKREDEQEFARLNGQNLMFCEDAARRLQAALEPQSRFRDYWLRVNHLESLHAHDAVAIATKRVPGGYQPIP